MDENKIMIAASKLRVLGCDGWSDVAQWSRMQYFLLGGDHRPIFIRSELLEGKRHTGTFIAERLEAVMTAEEFGLESRDVDGIIMDNAAVCSKASRVLKERYPHLTVYACGAHAANLLAQDMCKTAFVKDVLFRAQVVAKFFKY